jgi:aryl-phospho-beta-D-glucosidase BglC (GH1 family)
MLSSVNPLTVVGNRIVDSVTGLPVMLRGVNRSGLEYSKTPIPEEDLDEIVLDWGANVVRIPYNQEWALEDEGYLATLDHAVEGLAARNAYAILDLQWLDARYFRGVDNKGQPNYVPALPNDNSVEICRKLSNRYAHYTNVIFDIFNEPHDPLPGDDPGLPRRVTAEIWLPWARRLVDAIRQNSTGALILVPGTNWAYDLSAYPIDGLEGVVYSTHVYTSKGSDWDRAFGDLASQVPVFAGEWGGTASDIGWGEVLASYMAERNIGWTAWSWCDFPHLKQNGLPTPFGALVRGLLRPQQDS